MFLKKITPFFLLTSLFFIACNNNSERTGITIHQDDKIVNDSILALRKSVDSTNANLVSKTELLSDSIEGDINEMVYQGKNGLRIEWTHKTNKNKIELDDVVLVNYKMRITGGKVFDSNDKIESPIPLKTNIGMIIPGWEEALLLMHPGDKGRILVPSKLGYGEEGVPKRVPSNANLVIDLEIIEKIEPEVLPEGVKVYKWKVDTKGTPPVKDQIIEFDYFAYVSGKNGHLYDNSYKNDKSFKMRFENDNVVDGLHQGMQLMRENEAAFIYIPTNLAYGSKGMVDLVPKNSDIVYDVRIKSIK